MNESVVSKLNKKNSSGSYTPYPIGTAARYVSSIRGAGCNNIEEQMLIGMDCITQFSILEDGTQHIVEEYRKEEVTKNYYVLETFKFAHLDNARQFLEGNGLYVPGDLSDNEIFLDEDGFLTFYGKNYRVYKLDKYKLDENEKDTAYELNIDPEYGDGAVFILSTLKFINDEGNEINVARKVIYTAEQQGDFIIQKQIIENLL